MNRSLLNALVVTATLAAGCGDQTLGQFDRTQVKLCPAAQCTDPRPSGSQLICDDLSTGGPNCIEMTGGGCGWATLSCLAESTYVEPGTSIGACVLEYNSALVAEGADPCCAWVGGPNTCNRAVACNDRSGSGCCLIYATAATVGGMGCCLYEGGSTPHTAPGDDRTGECGGLLSGP